MYPLVSIIIPVYNAERFLGETLESACSQTYPNKEILVVDDGSIDSSATIVEAFRSHGVRLIRQENKGASAARNSGLLNSRGDYIQFLDADDLLDPYKIQFQAATSARYSDLHLIGSVWQRFEGDPSKTYLPHPYLEKETRYFDKKSWLINRPYMIPHTWLVSRKLIARAGLWNERLSFNDDGEFFYRVIAASAGVVIDHQARCFYRTGHAGSLSNKKDRVGIISWIESVKSYKTIVSELAGPDGNESVNRYFFEIGYHCIDSYPDLYRICQAEMYNPKAIYNLSDNLVFTLSKALGIQQAKKVRMLVNRVRANKAVASMIRETKDLIGWKSY